MDHPLYPYAAELRARQGALPAAIRRRLATAGGGCPRCAPQLLEAARERRKSDRRRAIGRPARRPGRQVMTSFEIFKRPLVLACFGLLAVCLLAGCPEQAVVAVKIKPV